MLQLTFTYTCVAERLSQDRSRAPERTRHVVQTRTSPIASLRFRGVRGGDGVRGGRQDTSWLLLSFAGAHIDSQGISQCINAAKNDLTMWERNALHE